MSEEYTQHANLFGFSHGLERSGQKPRIPGYNPTHIEHELTTGISGYEGTPMITDEFAFPPTLQPQLSHQFSPTAHQMPGIQADNATAMRVFLANPQYPPYGSAHPGVIHPPAFTWAPEGQALSLSLSSDGANNSGGFRPIQEVFSYSTSCLEYTNHEVVDHSISTADVVRNSRFSTAARELLEEFCSVGRPPTRNNPTPAIGNSTNHEADKITHQRRKAKLLSMLDEVERRYNQYCEQLQAVVSSFERVMGNGSAAPYTTLAHKAMSRHFRCLKDAVMAEVKRSCEALGEETAGTLCGLTRGETPRLKMLEQSLRQQRAFQQMGISEQEAWRPQRGLPERSVNILRAWLFEHFLHPYPSDADKHMLARQTGLSRNQVSNWFINARVRLWKPMVEEMYQQENKESEETRSNDTSTRTSAGGGWQLCDADTDPVGVVVDTQSFYDNQAKMPSDENESHVCPTSLNYRMGMEGAYGTSGSFGVADVGSTMIRFGTTTGDVSLTLGLHHGGHRPENSPFSVKDFRGC